jgi:hypothetical protein
MECGFEKFMDAMVAGWRRAVNRFAAFRGRACLPRKRTFASRAIQQQSGMNKVSYE